MQSRIRLISGRIPVTNVNQVTPDRYDYLDLASAEPNLGTANVGDVLIYDSSSLGGRKWVAGDRIGHQAFDKANAAYDAANTIAGGLLTANANISIIQGVDLGQNVTITAVNQFAQSAYDTANTKLNLTGGTITGSLSINNDLTVTGNLTVLGNSTIITANTLEVKDSLIKLAVGNYSSDVLDVGFAAHYNAGTNAHTGLIRDVGTKEWYLFQGYTPNIDANNNIDITNSSFQTSNLNASYVKGNLISTTAIVNGWDVASVFDTQNTTITAVNQFAQGAYDKANSSYNFANNISSSLSGNSIVLGANTTGLLVSNAVTLTTSTSITNGIASINQILGKLVPTAPATFPSTFGTLTINSVIGPYRMTNFTQTDNTGTSTASVAGGTSVNPLRVGTYTTSTITNINTLTGDIISVVKNAVETGTRTITDRATNAGTYSDLVIINNVDYATVTGIPANFWFSANLRASGTATAGWNNVSIRDTNGTPTSNATWYYDNSTPGVPTFATPSIVPLSPSLTYSSTVPHYNNTTTFRLGVAVSKLSGDLFPASNTFFTGTAGGAFAAPASNTYPIVGITYPLTRNLYVSSGSVTVNTTSTIISGFGLSATGPSVTVDNSYSTASQVFTTTLANTILYKTGTSSAMEEATGFIASGFGTAVGSGNAIRIVNYDLGTSANSTPVFSAGQTAFNSQTGTFYTSDATVVANILKNDVTNYSTVYLPPGPNLTTQNAAQYITLRMTRSSVSKFSINYTTTTGIGGIWCAMPAQTSYAAGNNWYSMTVDNSLTGGCALGGNLVPGATGARVYNCQFAGLNSSNATNNEILVRIRLNAGQSITALSFAASTI